MSQQLVLIETPPDVEQEISPEVRRGHRFYPVIAVVAACTAAILLSFLYTRIAQTVTVNSDHASIVLEAAAILAGNPLLHGWTLTNVSFYTLDLPFYLIALAWHGMTPAVMRDVPAVIYALTVVAAVWLAGRGPGSRRPLLSRAVTFILAGLPSLLVPQVILVGVDHVATTLVIIGALLAFDQSEGKPLSWFRSALFGLFCALLMVGDTMALWVFILPVAIVSVARSRRTPPDGLPERHKRTEAILLGMAMMALVIADLFSAVMHGLHGFSTVPLTIKIVSLADLPRNMVLTIGGLLSMFRANVFGRTVDAVTAGIALDVFGLAFVLWSLFHALRAWRTWNGGGDRVTQVLGLGMLINLTAYLFDSSVSNLDNTLYSPPERYLVPFFIFGAVLAGRWGIAHAPDTPRLKAAFGALGIIYAGLFAGQIQQPEADIPAARLGHWLASRHLTHGYGNFWCSSIVTVQSSGQVQIRPVGSDGKQIYPLRWFSDESWYKSGSANFLVYDLSHSERGDFYWQKVGPETACSVFGPPAEVDQVGQYTVMVWPKDITPGLKVTQP